MEIFEKSVGRKGIPPEFELFEDADFSMKRQKGQLIELQGSRGARQFQVTYKEFIFGITKVDDAEAAGMEPAQLCTLFYEGIRKFAEIPGKPKLATYRRGNRIWYAMDFLSRAKGKEMGNAIFATNFCTARGNKLIAIMLNWDMGRYGISQGYVDDVLESFTARIRKEDLRDGDAPIIGAVTVTQPPKLNSVGEILFEAGNAGKTIIGLAFSVQLLLNENPVFTSRDVESEPPALLGPGEVKAVRLAVKSPEFPEGNYELVLGAAVKGKKQLVEARIPVSFAKPS